MAGCKKGWNMQVCSKSKPVSLEDIFGKSAMLWRVYFRSPPSAPMHNTDVLIQHNEEWLAFSSSWSSQGTASPSSKLTLCYHLYKQGREISGVWFNFFKRIFTITSGADASVYHSLIIIVLMNAKWCILFYNNPLSPLISILLSPVHFFCSHNGTSDIFLFASLHDKARVGLKPD